MKTERRPILLALPLILFLLLSLSFSAASTTALEPQQSSCSRTAWQTVGPERVGRERARMTTIWKERGETAFFFKAKMAIDADGSPRAYHPDNTGLEDNSNGKDENGRWVGVVVVGGRPHVQGPGDPYPGYYVSPTSLTDPAIREDTNPRKYVDSEAIPYIALPPKTAYREGRCVRDGKACLGDMAFVLNSSNGKSAFAIVADIGPGRKVGEASIALAKALGIPSSPRSGGTDDGIYYLVFPGSGNEKPRSLDEINAIGAERLSRWGGKEKLSACLTGPR
jgi:Fungal chitosanase of glycosyl hydrolase group 75